MICLTGIFRLLILLMKNLDILQKRKEPYFDFSFSNSSFSLFSISGIDNKIAIKNIANPNVNKVAISHGSIFRNSKYKKKPTMETIIAAPIKPKIFPIMVSPLQPKRVKRPSKIMIAKSHSIFIPPFINLWRNLT